jgi:hypothetical protein
VTGVGRLVRPALVALVVAGCAATAHTAAGGEASLVATAAVAAAAGLVATLLRGRRLTSGQVLGLLALGQVGLHLAEPASTHDLAMVSSHAAATLASLLVLRHAEDFWWALADRVVGTLHLRALPVPVPSAPGVLVRPSSRRGRLVLRVVPGRAPPAWG